MIKRIRHARAGSSQQGFTLVEFLVVIIVIGILLAIAVPSYIGLRDRANDNAARSNLRAALPAVEAFYANTGSYTGMDLMTLQGVDRSVKLDGDPAVLESGAGYCIQSTVGLRVWSITGPGDTKPVEATCP